MRRALELSLNAATVRVAESGRGCRPSIETARALGLGGELAPSAGDGARHVRGDADRAGARLPADRQRRPAAARRRSPCATVRDRDGTVDPSDADEPAAVITPAEAYLITSLLEGVIASGTGASARALGVAGAVAGKTGTTNDGRDAWFVGYSPRLLVAVWVGFDGGDAPRAERRRGRAADLGRLHAAGARCLSAAGVHGAQRHLPSPASISPTVCSPTASVRPPDARRSWWHRAGRPARSTAASAIRSSTGGSACVNWWRR